MGGRLMWTWYDVSLSLAYMATYPDGGTPALGLNHDGDPVIKVKFPSVQIVGLTATTPLSPLNLDYTVLRTEVAGFFGDPFFIEKQNFRLNVPIPKRNVIRAVIGFDHNQWWRFLNSQNTFTITGQLFFTGIQGGVGGIKVPLQRKSGKYMDVDRTSYVNTFGISTLYSAANFFDLSQFQPNLTFQYDWEGAWALLPSITFLRDPFRFQILYNYIEGRFISSPGSGIGTLKDKDNFGIRIDYLL